MSQAIRILANYGMTIGVSLSSLLTLINSSWNFSFLVEVGGSKEDMKLKLLVFTIATFFVFFLESRKEIRGVKFSSTISLVRIRIIALILLITVTVSTILRSSFPNFSRIYYHFFGVNQLDLSSADLDYFVKTTSCPGNFKVGSSINCSGESITYLYPSSLIREALAFLDLRRHLEFLQLFQLGLLVAVVLFACYKGGQLSFWLMVLLLISPQMQLLMERGNIDLFVLSITMLASIFFAQKRDLYNWLGFSCLILGSLLKFYLFPAVVLTSFILFKRRKRLLAIIATLALSVQLIPEIYLSSTSSISELKGTFGFKSFIFFVNGLENTVNPLPNVISLFTSILICAIPFASGYLKGKSIFRGMKNFGSENLVLAITFLSLWFFANNYHYKLVFLTISLLFLSQNLESTDSAKKGITLVVLLNVFSLLAYRETLFLVSNVVIVYCCGMLSFVFLANFLVSRPVKSLA